MRRTPRKRPARLSIGAVHRLARRLVILTVLLAGALWLFSLARRHPQDLPWTKLDPAAPVGLFTGRKIAALTTQPPADCRALLQNAGVAFTPLAPVEEAGSCGYRDAVRLLPRDRTEIALAPVSVGMSCPVALGLKIWEWQVVQPVAERMLGTSVRRIEHFGSYNCRRMYNRPSGDMSEHATADAIDISAFILSDGRRISIVNGWSAKAETAQARKDADFLRVVRDGACRLFSTVLSPDYNAAHRDHLHLDQAERGARGWRACR